MPWDHDAFWTALAVAGVAAALVAAVALLGPRRDRTVPAAGAVLLLGWLAALPTVQTAETVPDPDPPILALLLLGAASLGTGRFTSPWPGILLLPGAALVPIGTGAPLWAAVAAVAATVVGTIGLGRIDRIGSAVGAGPVVVGISAVGVWLTIPDTDNVVTLLGAAIPFSLLAFPYPLASIGAAFCGPAVAALTWSTLIGGLGRDGSMIGGLGCLGLCLVVPWVRSLRDAPRPGRADFSQTIPRLILLHGATVLFVSRVAGRPDSAGAATVLTLVGLAAGGWVATRSALWTASRSTPT